MSERIEEIRERTEKLKVSSQLQIAAGHVARDYTYLLERIGELERENERLQTECEGLHAMIQQTTTHISPKTTPGTG